MLRHDLEIQSVPGFIADGNFNKTRWRILFGRGRTTAQNAAKDLPANLQPARRFQKKRDAGKRRRYFHHPGKAGRDQFLRSG